MTDGARTLTIPQDLPGCQAFIEQLIGTVDSQTAKIEELQKEKQVLELEKAELLQWAFRKRSERYIKDPNQLEMDFGPSDDVADAAEGLAQAVEESGQRVREHVRHRRKPKPRDEGLPDHLPRYEVEADVSDEVKQCSEHGERKVIGHDRVETLEFTPPELRVRVTKYPKLGCEGHPACGIASPERPTGLVEGDRYDTSVAAEIITAKYGYHLPIYRQQDLFASGGWTPARSTLLNILTACAFVFRPLAEHIKQVVLASGIVGTDDTRVTLLLPAVIPKVDPNDPKSQRIHEVFSAAIADKRPSVTARMWAYRSVTTPLNVFDFTVSRHRDGPDLMLANFRGILLADCYTGYEGIALASDGAIRRAACNAHARRKIFEAREVYPVEASFVLSKYQQLYDIEDQAKTMSADERLKLRQSEAKPIWDSLEEWRQSKAVTDLLHKNKFSQALGYLGNQWEALQTYLSDGRVPIDNNDTEQLMKLIALGRKNWVFIGSVAAGERAADFFTLVSSAVRNDLDVWVYLKNILDRLLAGETNMSPLRPDVWRESHPEAIRAYRVEERRDRAERKQYRRACRRRANRR